jgi:hypothetical protein
VSKGGGCSAKGWGYLFQTSKILRSFWAPNAEKNLKNAQIRYLELYFDTLYVKVLFFSILEVFFVDFSLKGWGAPC